MIECTKIVKKYGEFTALEIPDLKIVESLCWIQGANGSGKSTFFKTIAGIHDFEGDVLLDGAISLKKNPSQYRMNVNYAPAEPQFPSFASGFDIIRFISESKNGNEQQIKEYATAFQATSWLSNPISSYSSGMLKKTAVIAAFCGSPHVIILDEPFITLDVESVQLLTELILQKNKQGVCFFISSHQSAETEKITFERKFLIRDKKVQCL